MIRGSHRRVLATLTLLAPLAACRAIDSKVWNLKQLHDETSHHRYSGALEGDTEYFLRHEVTRLFTGVGISMRFAEKSPSEIEDPSAECLDVLLDLQNVSNVDARTRALQVEWFARLAVEDPSRLSRERCAYALGNAGRAIEAGMPGKLSAKAPVAGAPAVGAALTSLIAAAKPWTDGSATSASELDLVAACDVVRGLVLDLDGARRALDLTAELLDKLPRRATKPIEELARDLERMCVRQALATALVDTDPWVRAAAVQGSVECGGPRVLDAILAQLEREPAPEVLIRVMWIVRTRGLGAEESDARRRHWTRSIYALMSTHPDPSVRVAAMAALGKISGAQLASLREEDWQDWWRTHAPAADATDDASAPSDAIHPNNARDRGDASNPSAAANAPRDARARGGARP